LDFFLSGEIFLFLSFFITFFPLFLLDVSISRIFLKNIYDKIWWKNKKKTSVLFVSSSQWKIRITIICS
jgi:hypothetical protein